MARKPSCLGDFLRRAQRAPDPGGGRISSNPALIPHPTVNYTSPNGTGSLTLTTQPSVETVVNVTVTVRDDGNANNLVTRTFAVTIGSSNQPPIVTRISDQVAYANAPRTVGFAVGDEETPSTNLTISVSSSNPGLIPDEAIVIGGMGLAEVSPFTRPRTRLERRLSR